MKFATRFFLTTVALVFALAVTSSADQGFDKSEQKCRGIISKGYSKAVATAGKVIGGCHKSRLKGKVAIGTACNDLGVADSPPVGKAKFAKATSKLTSGIGKKCVALDNDLLDQYISCPDPCLESTGASNPLASFSELGACLACLAAERAEGFAANTSGLPDISVFDKSDGKCHGTIGKGYSKCFGTILKEQTKCQKGQDKAHNNDLATCTGADPKGKVSGCFAKAASGMDKKCSDTNVPNMDSCAGGSDLAALKTCLRNETEAGAADVFTDCFGFSAAACPVQVISTIHAGTTVTGNTTQSRLDAGWTGMGHNVDLVDGYGFTVNVSCPNAEPPCGECALTGIDAAASAALVRCVDDTTVQCTNPFGLDAVCPGSKACAIYLGPPLPLSSSNTPVCVINTMTSDITGTANPETGDGAFSPYLKSKTHMGEVKTQPCPLCEGDTTHGDGYKDGICKDGPSDGLTCDTHAVSPTFGPVSLDCPPSVLQNISGTGLEINLNLTTHTVEMPFENDNDYPSVPGLVACGVCSGNTAYPCANNAECAAAGHGACDSYGGGVGRLPNACNQGETCVDAEGAGGSGIVGECPTGPTDTYCDGEVRANGNGFLTCGSDAECRVSDPECGDGSQGSCGNCTLAMQRACFLDPVRAVGTPSTDAPTVVSIFCIPPLSSDAVNAAAGLPGPGRVYVSMETEMAY